VHQELRKVWKALGMVTVKPLVRGGTGKARGDLEAVRFPGGRLRISQRAWMAFLAERSTMPAGSTLDAVDREV